MPPRKSSSVRHVALLRGINVGKAKRIAMADLRELCEGLGYGDVKTLLNSGNLIFSAPRADAKAAAKIEQEILQQLGISSRVLVVTGEEIDEIVAENPFEEGETNPSRLLVTVFASTVDRAKLRELAGQDWGADKLAIGSRAAYTWCAQGLLDSKPASALGRLLGENGTSRNWATMRKLQALMSGSGAAA